MLRRPITSDFNARRLPRRRTVRSMLTAEQMSIAVQRETARADRSDGEFALVLFRVRNDQRKTNACLRLARALLKRIRATDDIGWYDDEHVGVLLPDTTPAGAWRFADTASNLELGRTHKPLLSVYCYPTKWFNAPNSGAVAGPVSANRDDSNDEDHSSGDGGLGVRNLIPFFLDGVKDGLETQPPSAVHRLETLLVRPLPWWKRAIDITGASIGIAIASPLMIASAIGIKLTSRGPVVFAQQRAGLGGRPFTIFKFRTMVVDAEARKKELMRQNEQDGAAFKIKDDPRVTKIGKILRKTSIDELPQLFNVLRGDMTLVGPRPLPVNEAEACEGWQRRRLDVTPGLTCIWQVRGRSRVSFAEWVRMDVAYIRRRTLWHDIVILAQTIPAVLMRRGAR